MPFSQKNIQFLYRQKLKFFMKPFKKWGCPPPLLFPAGKLNLRPWRRFYFCSGKYGGRPKCARLYGCRLQEGREKMAAEIFIVMQTLWFPNVGIPKSSRRTLFTASKRRKKSKKRSGFFSFHARVILRRRKRHDWHCFPMWEKKPLKVSPPPFTQLARCGHTIAPLCDSSHSLSFRS